MITSLARGSVIIKAGREDSALLGNYECAYALGVMSRVSGLSLPEGREDMKALHRDFMEKLRRQGYAPTDQKEERLLQLLRHCQPDAEMNGEMKELLAWGEKEERLWQM